MSLLLSEFCACVWHVRCEEIIVIPLECEAWPMEIVEVVIMMVFPMESETLAISIVTRCSRCVDKGQQQREIHVKRESHTKKSDDLWPLI